VKIFLSHRERLAGLFIVVTVALVAIFFVGAALQNRWLAPRVRFHTRVAMADGLRKGSPILLSGIEVGEIGELTIAADNKIDVELLVLRKHAHRVREGTEAVVRRLFGIGEKRIHLVSREKPGKELAQEARLPAREPMDLLEVMTELDLGTYLRAMNRALGTLEVVLEKLEENQRLDRMVGAFDRIGPTMEKVDGLLTELHDPLVAVLTDPALRGTLAGANGVLNDPATKKTLRGAAAALEPGRLDPLITRVDALVTRLTVLTGDNGQLPHVLGSADKFLSDGRIDRLVSSFEKLTDEKKLGRIIDNVGMLAEQTSKIGPEIPQITRELTSTLREAVVVLKALQKTWLLKGKAEEVREESTGMR
jgi:hypothetical protein